MSFMEKIIERNIPIWDRCMETPFISELQKGILPFEKFREYIIQDSIYLKNYARIFGKAIYHASTLRDIQRYYAILSFATDKESVVRLRYLDEFGITDDMIEEIDPLSENRNYIDFMMKTAERGKECEILMSVLPCMLSYSYIFRRIVQKAESRGSRYWDFMEDYGDDLYYEECKSFCRFADKKCQGASKEEQNILAEIFEKASMLELDFWKMAYENPASRNYY